MVNERKSMLINPMSCDQINEFIFKHHNYNGAEAHNDLLIQAKAEQTRRRMKNSMPMWMGLVGIAGYNVTRMGVLSPSGRIGAIGGLAFSTFALIESMRV